MKWPFMPLLHSMPLLQSIPSRGMTVAKLLASSFCIPEKNANELESKLEPLPFICQLRRFACKFNGQALDSRTLGGYGRQVQTSLNQAFVFSVFSRNQVKTKPLTWRSLPVSRLRGSSFAIISAHVQGPGPGPEFKFSKTVEVGWSC